MLFVCLHNKDLNIHPFFYIIIFLISSSALKRRKIVLEHDLEGGIHILEIIRFGIPKCHPLLRM